MFKTKSSNNKKSEDVKKSAGKVLDTKKDTPTRAKVNISQSLTLIDRLTVLYLLEWKHPSTALHVTVRRLPIAIFYCGGEASNVRKDVSIKDYITAVLAARSPQVLDSLL